MAGDVRPPAPPDGGQLPNRDGATRLAAATVRSFRIVQREGTRDAKKLDAAVAGNLRELGERELDAGATIRSFRIVQREGTRGVTRSVVGQGRRKGTDQTFVQEALAQKAEEAAKLDETIVAYSKGQEGW